mmetsp:Transcript_28055/g.66714  ORF Transcript_28055/g.66714 Transcript_28055/m.66714 type:complete len:97 (-) Transcript_28055:1952-2242(-)
MRTSVPFAQVLEEPPQDLQGQRQVGCTGAADSVGGLDARAGAARLAASATRGLADWVCQVRLLWYAEFVTGFGGRESCGMWIPFVGLPAFRKPLQF